MKILYTLLLVATVIWLFYWPVAAIYCAKELFGLDWSGKYWTVFLLSFVLYSLFSVHSSKK